MHAHVTIRPPEEHSEPLVDLRAAVVVAQDLVGVGVEGPPEHASLSIQSTAGTTPVYESAFSRRQAWSQVSRARRASKTTSRGRPRRASAMSASSFATRTTESD